MMAVVNIRYENGERRKIGWIEGETFFSPRKPSKHLFREDVRPLRRPDGTGVSLGT